MICNPNNPTGTLYSREELMRLRDLVKKYDLFLFADEVYREFIYSDAPYTSAMHLEGIEDNVIMIDSVSKRYSECGIRIGAFITRNKEVRTAAMKLAQARLSPPCWARSLPRLRSTHPRPTTRPSMTSTSPAATAWLRA